jgi:hypothetical protein
MIRFRHFALTAVSAVLLAGCAEPTTAPVAAETLRVVGDGSALSSIRAEGRRSRFKFHPTRDAITVSNAATSKTTSTPTLASGMVFHGGPVLQAKTNVFNIYWAGTPIFVNGPKTGTGLGTADLSIVGYFLRYLGGSGWFNINTTYTSAAGLKIANVVNYTGYWANATNAPASGATVTDADVLTMLQSGFTAGTLKYDSSTVYAVFTGPKVNLGGGAGTTYCAYHSAAKLTIGGVSRVVLYTAQPYGASWPTTCAATTVSANGDLGADVQVNMLAHEIAETTTNMLGTAWYDANGYENADKCAWNFGTTSVSTLSKSMKFNVTLGGKYFLIQTNWQNYSTGGCVIKF